MLLRAINPLYIFFSGWLLWIFIFAGMPVQTELSFYLKHPALKVLIEYNLFFLAGVVLILFIVKKPAASHIDLKISGERLYRPLLVLVFFSCLVVAMQLVEILYLMSKADNLIELRKLSRNPEHRLYPSWLNYNINLFFKLSIFPIFVFLVKKKKLINGHKIMFAIVVFLTIYPLFNYLWFGKRAFTFMTIFIYLWYVLYFDLWKNKLFMSITGVLLVVIFLVSALTFEAREVALNRDMQKSVNLEHSYSKTVLPTAEFNNSVKQDFATGNKIYANTRLYLMSFAQYYTHGLFEFFNLYDFRQKQSSPLAHGRFTFSMFYKLLPIIGFDIDLKNPYRFDNRTLYFDSFFGSQLKDWGKHAKYFMLLYGVIFALAFRLVLRYKLITPFYAILSSIVFLFPVASMIINSQAWHYISLSILFAVTFYTYLWRKQKSS